METANDQTNRNLRLRRLAFAIVLIAVGVALAPFTSIPLGFAKVNPTQAFVNVLAAVAVGPAWGVFVAYGIGQIRLLLGLGTLFAFPGGMIGALLAGLLYLAFRRIPLAALGEVVGTGLVAPAFIGWVMAPAIHSQASFWALLPGFMASTLAGSLLAVAVAYTLRRTGLLGAR